MGSSLKGVITALRAASVAGPNRAFTTSPAVNSRVRDYLEHLAENCPAQAIVNAAKHGYHEFATKHPKFCKEAEEIHARLIGKKLESLKIGIDNISEAVRAGYLEGKNSITLKELKTDFCEKSGVAPAEVDSNIRTGGLMHARGVIVTQGTPADIKTMGDVHESSEQIYGNVIGMDFKGSLKKYDNDLGAISAAAGRNRAPDKLKSDLAGIREEREKLGKDVEPTTPKLG